MAIVLEEAIKSQLYTVTVFSINSMDKFTILLKRVQDHLNSNKQCWLLGAGISCQSNIPTMHPLTRRIQTLISKEEKKFELYNSIADDLESGNSHIEHYLSHIGDLIALSKRSKGKNASIGINKITQSELEDLHKHIVEIIGEIIRNGYQEKTDISEELIGESHKPIIKLDNHSNFIKELFRNKANIENRSEIAFFTTNYDTLLEDALSLEGHIVIDGFSGGAVGFWNPEYEFEQRKKERPYCCIYKLHGSIDWYVDANNRLIRNRNNHHYGSESSLIMIYPQATKYLETQKDPFSYLFNRFRSKLNSEKTELVLLTCGYSFGDDHINNEIEIALNQNSQITLIAFIKECGASESDASKTTMHPILNKWLSTPKVKQQVFVLTDKGIYNNGLEAVVPIQDQKDLKEFSWWRFNGLTQFIRTGNPL